MDFSQLEQKLSAYLKTTQIPGFSLALSDREQTLYTFTYTSDAVNDPKITPDTLFEIGSIGKSFTSILIQQLVDVGQFDLHLPVTNYLPWLKIPSEFGPIAPHHLLSHTAGIINGAEFSGETLAEIFALRKSPTSTPPGTRFYYSNVGYKVLGAILEQVTGRSYGDLVRERIIEPLGLKGTFPVITHDLRPRMAVGYKPLYDDRPKAPSHPIAPAPWLETATADGCIAATPSDLAAYMRMFMNNGREGVLSAEGYQRMIQPVIEAAPARYYGYGLAILELPEGQYIGHSGGMVGYGSQMIWTPALGYGFTYMTNVIGIPDVPLITEWLVKVLAALVKQEDLPALEAPAPSLIENAENYIGTYHSHDQQISITAEDQQLSLVYNGTMIPLMPQAPDHFLCLHPNFERFLLNFERNEDGAVVAVTHGESLYVPAGKDVVLSREYPPIWEAYRGHYRSYNPWNPAFRVLLRDGKLYIQFGGSEESLTSIGDHAFRVGDEKSPERLSFDWLLDGKTLQARFNCAPYYRTFTP